MVAGQACHPVTDRAVPPWWTAERCVPPLPTRPAQAASPERGNALRSRAACTLEIVPMSRRPVMLRQLQRPGGAACLHEEHVVHVGHHQLPGMTSATWTQVLTKSASRNCQGGPRLAADESRHHARPEHQHAGVGARHVVTLKVVRQVGIVGSHAWRRTQIRSSMPRCGRGLQRKRHKDMPAASARERRCRPLGDLQLFVAGLSLPAPSTAW